MSRILLVSQTMHFTMAEISGWVGSFMWPLLRIGGLVMALPAFSARNVPMQIKLIFALVLTLVIVPIVPDVPDINPLSGEGLLIVINQILIGVSMGFTLRIVFSALITAGQMIALGMGLGFASMVDPTNGVQVPVVSMFYSIIGVLLFFSVNGHLVAIQVIADSFISMPISPSGIPVGGYMDLVLWGTWIFAGAVLIALPAITAILVVNIAFGVMTRASPQLNIFAVGFPVIMTVGFAFMMFSLGHVETHFVRLTNEGLTLMRQLVNL